MKAADWIDRVKLAKGWESDYRAAKELACKPNTISTYRAHGGPMEEGIALRVAEALQLDPAIVLADQAMERAKSADARSAWAAVLQRLGGVAAGFLVAVGLSSAPGPAQAGLNKTSCASTGMHIASTKRRRRRKSNGITSMIDQLKHRAILAPA